MGAQVLAQHAGHSLGNGKTCAASHYDGIALRFFSAIHIVKGRSNVVINGYQAVKFCPQKCLPSLSSEGSGFEAPHNIGKIHRYAPGSGRRKGALTGPGNIEGGSV
ncbi:MAG: hypothetical protein ACREVY_18330 [Gammaproteobacteria bacterium]